MEKLLVVDDDEARLKKIVRVAESVQFKTDNIQIAVGLADAIELIDGTDLRYDFAIIDLILTAWPEKEGLDVIKLLRAKFPNCKIIALTAHGGTALGIEAMSAGADDFISTQWEQINWYSLLQHRLQLWRGLFAEISTRTF